MIVPSITWGMKVCVDDNLLTKRWSQVRYPKSKKRRIRNKWKKDRRNYREKEEHNMIQIGNVLYVTKKVYEEINNVIKDK